MKNETEFFTVKKHIEDYACIFIGPDGVERDTPWTTRKFESAVKVAKYWNGFVEGA